MKIKYFLMMSCFTLVIHHSFFLFEATADEPKAKMQAAQYRHEQIVIPAASADEPVRKQFSFELAAAYLENGATAWMKQRKCISCHTNAIYMTTRPALTKRLGKPSGQMRAFYIGQLEKFETEEKAKQVAKRDKQKPKPEPKLRPTQIAYLAAGLAAWDAHVTKELTPETERALRLMFRYQSDDGSWGNEDCWPPLESSHYHATTVAAIAAAEAPGWLADIQRNQGEKKYLAAGVEKMKSFLRQQEPPHDYARLLLLHTSNHMSGLISPTRRKELIAMVLKHQLADGGWSLRTFAAPEEWGSGNREKKLRAESEFDKPASDGHQTGLVLLALRGAGLPADDLRIRRGVRWLLSNQRESGRWWTRSLNTDRFHFITYSGTAYPLLALEKCGAIEQPVSK